MAWLAVDGNGEEYVYESKPKRYGAFFVPYGEHIKLPEGSIEKLIGRKLTWDDEPIEI